MENVTLQIDAETHDLIFDSSGNLCMISDHETSAQCVRLTLECFLGEWFLDETHGTEYQKIIENTESEADDILRRAVYQEPDVRSIDSIDISVIDRNIYANIRAKLMDGTAISVGVQNG